MRVLISPPVITKVPAKQPSSATSADSSDIIVTASVSAALNGHSSGASRPTTSSSVGNGFQQHNTMVELMAVGSVEDLRSVSSDSTDSSVRYGPGIVRRLAQKFATIAAANESSVKNSFNRHYRSRAASCDNLLGDGANRYETGANGEVSANGLDRKFSLSHSCIHTAEIEEKLRVDLELHLNDQSQQQLTTDESMAVLRMAQRFEPAFHIPPAKLSKPTDRGTVAAPMAPKSAAVNFRSFSVDENPFEPHEKFNGYGVAPSPPSNVVEDSGPVPEFVKVSQHLRSVPMLQRRPSTRYNYKASVQQSVVKTPVDITRNGTAVDSDAAKPVQVATNGLVKEIVSNVAPSATLPPSGVSPPRLRSDPQLFSTSVSPTSPHRRQVNEEAVKATTNAQVHLRKPFQKSFSEDVSSSEIVVKRHESVEDPQLSGETPKVADILKKFGGTSMPPRLTSKVSAKLVDVHVKTVEEKENTSGEVPVVMDTLSEAKTDQHHHLANGKMDETTSKAVPLDEVAKITAIRTSPTAKRSVPSSSIDKAPQIKRKTLTSQHWLKKQAEAEASGKPIVSPDKEESSAPSTDASGELFGVKLKKVATKPADVLFDSQQSSKEHHHHQHSPDDKGRTGSYDLIKSDSTSTEISAVGGEEVKRNFERRGSLDIAMPSTDIDQLIAEANGVESDDDWAQTDDIVAGSFSPGGNAKLSRSNIAQGSGPGVQLLSYSPADFDAKMAEWSYTGSDDNGLIEDVSRRQLNYDEEDEEQLLDDVYTEPFHYEFFNSEVLVDQGILAKTSKTVKSNLEWSNEDPKAYAYELEEDAIVWDPGMELDMENYRKICQEIKEETAKKREQLMQLLEQEPSSFAQGGLARYTPNTLLFEQYHLGESGNDVMVTDANGLSGDNYNSSDSVIPIRILTAEKQDGLVKLSTEDQIYDVKPTNEGPVWSDATCDSELLMF